MLNSSNKAYVSGGRALSVSGTVRVPVAATRIKAYIDANGYWVGSNDSYCVRIPVTVGVSYRLRWTTTTSSKAGTIFRWGFTDSNEEPGGQQLYDWVRSTPQSTASTTVTATKQYLIIQISASYAATILNNKRLIVEAIIS